MAGVLLLCMGREGFQRMSAKSGRLHPIFGRARRCKILPRIATGKMTQFMIQFTQRKKCEMKSKGGNSMRKIISAALFLVLLCSLLPAGAYATQVDSAPLTRNSQSRNGMVRVYLSSMGNVKMLDITVAGSYTADGPYDMPLQNGEKLNVTFSTSTGQITMNRGGVSYAMGQEMAFRRHQTSGSNGLKIGQSRQPNNLYPGDLYLKAQPASGGYKLYAIVHVYIENYLNGVLPYEMGNSAPMEALKAQAVAARTYTLNKMETRAGSLYDVVDTTNDQVYYGNSETTANCTSAVAATKGIVVMNGNKLTGTYYTASNGGQTESARNVWNSSGYDYLTVKDDPFDRMNPASITRSVTVYGDNSSSQQKSALNSLLTSKAAAALRTMGWNSSGTQVTRIHAITPHTPKYPAPSRLYTKMDFDVTATCAGGTTSLTLTCDIFSELESALGMSINASANELWTVNRTGDNFTLAARRFGHGIGMSQRGAMQMGSLGYTYDQILGFYYEDCRRVQHTFTHTVLPPVGMGGGIITTPEDPAEIIGGGENQAVVRLVGVNDRLAVRGAASTSGNILTSVVNGSPVTVLAKGESWTLIRLGRIAGYVPTNALRFTGTPPTVSDERPTLISQWATVSCTGTLNLRSEASLNGRVLSAIPDGAVLAVFSVSGGWANVQYGASFGWASMDFLRLSDHYPGTAAGEASTQAVVTVPSGSGTVNMRSTASTSGAVLQTLPHGTTVTLQSNDGSWCFVQAGGINGFIMTKFLRMGEGGEPLPEEPDQPGNPGEPSLPDGLLEAVVRTTQGSLNMRQQPSTSSVVLMTLPRGESVAVLDRGAEWCAVRYGSVTGYVATQYLYFPSDEQGSTPQQYAVVTTVSGPLNMRSQPAAGSSIVTQIPKGARVGVLEKMNTWYHVSYNGRTGYAMATYLTLEGEEQLPQTGGYATVTTPTGSLNLRETPSMDARILTTIPRGMTMPVISRENGWCRVDYAGYTGYVMEKFVTITANKPDTSPDAPAPDADGVRVQTGGGSLNLRRTANATAPILTTIPNGAKVELLENYGEWAKVKYNIHVGYVVARYLNLPVGPDLPEIIAVVDTASGGLNLRETDSADARVLAVLARGTKVNVLDWGSQWSRISTGGLTGYVMTKFLNFDPSEPEGGGNGTAWITANIVGGVNLRQSPSTDALILITIAPGAEINVYSHDGTWSRVTHGGYTGYVQSRFIVNERPRQDSQPEQTLGVRYIATPSGNLNLREAPSMDAAVLTAVPRRSAVTLLEESGPWSRIQFNQYTGWVIGDYLSYAVPAPDAPETARINPAEGSVNIRAAASADAGILGSLPKGTVVTVLEWGESWSRICSEELEGYCMTRFLTQN